MRFLVFFVSCMVLLTGCCLAGDTRVVVLSEPIVDSTIYPSQPTKMVVGLGLNDIGNYLDNKGNMGGLLKFGTLVPLNDKFYLMPFVIGGYDAAWNLRTNGSMVYVPNDNLYFRGGAQLSAWAEANPIALDVNPATGVGFRVWEHIWLDTEWLYDTDKESTVGNVTIVYEF